VVLTEPLPAYIYPVTVVELPTWLAVPEMVLKGICRRLLQRVEVSQLLLRLALDDAGGLAVLGLLRRAQLAALFGVAFGERSFKRHLFFGWLRLFGIVGRHVLPRPRALGLQGFGLIDGRNRLAVNAGHEFAQIPGGDALDLPREAINLAVVVHQHEVASVAPGDDQAALTRARDRYPQPINSDQVATSHSHTCRMVGAC